MKFMNWMITVALGMFLFSVSPVTTLAQGNGNGHGQGNGNGHGKGHNKHDDDDEDSYYKHHEEETVRGWYSQNEGHLPPGLQKKIQPVPVELERRLPPPPPNCVNVFIGGHIVLLNQHTNVVVDIFHFEAY